MKALENVLQRAEQDADVLKRYGQPELAGALLKIVVAVRAAARPYLTFISEPKAIERSGHGIEWLRARRKVWAEDGLAEKRDRGWFYCELVIPRRPTTPRIEAVQAEAQRLAAKHRGGAR